MTPAGEARILAAVDELAEAIIAALDDRPAAAPDRLLDVDEAAAMLGLGRSRLYALIGARELRSLTVGRRRLVPSSAVAAFIAERERAA